MWTINADLLFGGAVGTAVENLCQGWRNNCGVVMKLTRSYVSDQRILSGAAGNRTRFGVLVSEPNRH